MHHSILVLALAASDASALLTKRNPQASESETAITITSTAPTPDLTTHIITSIISITPTAPEQPASTVTITSTRTASASSNPSRTPTSPTPYPHDSSNSNSSSEYYEEEEEPAARACAPTNPTTGRLDFSAPCNLVAAIEVQCSYGPKALESLSNNPSSNSPKSHPLSPSAERTCICQSQIVDVTLGCWACFNAHEPPSPSSAAGETFSHDELETFLHSMMGRYCDVGFTPTQSFLEFYYEAEWDAFGWGGSEVGEEEDGDEAPSSSSTSTYTYASSTYASDPIGTSTDVSLYYTMSVTRSDAYDLALPTGAGGTISFTSTRVSEGMIVPTAIDNIRELGSSSVSASRSGSEGAVASTTSSADSDSGATTAYAGVARLLFAVVALVAVGL